MAGKKSVAPQAQSTTTLEGDALVIKYRQLIVGFNKRGDYIDTLKQELALAKATIAALTGVSGTVASHAGTQSSVAQPGELSTERFESYKAAAGAARGYARSMGRSISVEFDPNEPDESRRYFLKAA